MTQKRDLVPLTVYLPVSAREEADRRAQEQALATGTLLRQILLGHEKPLRSPSGRH